jgi:uncharacterized protein (DUF433 family)
MTATLDRPAHDLDSFEVPLYSVAEAARYLDVPRSTLAAWAQGYGLRPGGRAAPVLTSLPKAGRRNPVIPFVGLAEGLVLAAMRESGVPLQRIRPALTRLSDELGLQHALASKRLHTDGAEVLFDYAENGDNDEAAQAARELVVVRNDQRVFNDVVESYLQRVDFDDRGYARLIHLPAYEVADVIVDPSRGFGQPIFAKGGARIEDAIALFRAGESLETVAVEFGAPLKDVEDAVRIATRVSV